ncbi:hypothetical protein LTR78_010990 [Recurvomyces mirabilis]|uniref:Uncharacterized protein n=1 Tax=Recurvomyces mirabilis TaxID=574656 RepID=A0AAE0TLT3_9PEZI|nr:hypothetical protein LTR78_010990 [Recurvomyces mirabilis]
MALLAPEKVTGIIPLGTSMDYEWERTRSLGCWNGPADLTPSIDAWTTTKETPEFEPGEEYSDFLIDSGFGKECEAETRKFWNNEIRVNYQGDNGRRTIRMAAINLRERDGLLGWLVYFKCPVLWLHGTANPVYSVSNAE